MWLRNVDLLVAVGVRATSACWLSCPQQLLAEPLTLGVLSSMLCETVGEMGYLRGVKRGMAQAAGSVIFVREVSARTATSADVHAGGGTRGWWFCFSIYKEGDRVWT